VLSEISRRYESFRKEGVLSVDEYNEKCSHLAMRYTKIIFIIDEVGEYLSYDYDGTFNFLLSNVTSLGALAGVHVVLATQRVTANMLSGALKTTIPTRIAFKMATESDSLVILGESGAENLCSSGEMLFRTASDSMSMRALSPYIESKDFARIIYDRSEENKEIVLKADLFSAENKEKSNNDKIKTDALEVLREFLIKGKKTMSISSIQREFSYGFPKSAKIFDWLVQEGCIDNSQIGKQKTIAISMEEFFEKYGYVTD
jgi:S-DNA-T family DNA segregation ATPase FtsK/SpoIIIE